MTTEKSSDLEALRDREDFKELIAGLESLVGQAPVPNEQGSP